MTTTIAHIQILPSAQQHRFASTFDYLVPAQLTISIGQIVYVPLGAQIVSGIVLEISSAPTVPTSYKSILVSSTFQLSPVQIKFAQWLARHYAYHVADALSAFIPQYAIAHPQRHWQCTSAGYAAELHTLPADERNILYIAQRHSVITEASLATRFSASPTTLRAHIKLLIARGYMSEHYTIGTPEVRLPSVQMVTLVTTPQPSPRASAQAAIIAQLLAAPAHTLPAATFPQKAALKRLAILGVVRLYEQSVTPAAPPPLPTPVQLTATQQQVVDAITTTLGSQHTFLIDGVTGSGKTEVYCAVIRATIARSQPTLVLIPEIALTTQLAARFEARFPGRVVLLHGQLTPAQRLQRWHDIAQRRYDVIIGPRSALFAPIPQLGLIVIDEEHDSSYKSDAGLRFHARDSAIMYAKFNSCPVVLGSATPSVEVMAATQEGRITRLLLPERVDVDQMTIPRPPIRIIDLRTEATIDAYGLIGTTLATHIHSHIAAQHHVLLLLNRRGSISARICRHCSATEHCPQCSTPLVIHAAAHGLVGVCHSCGKNSYVNNFCSQCYHNEFLDIGSGTQRLADVVQHHWPAIPLIRWDSDTAHSARDHARLLAEIQAERSAIIVGTQMIAKGFDLPNIRLVGVVNTDTALHLPDIRAAERTYQLLTQVAGRAGRRAGDADVIFQTYKPDHYAIIAAARYDSEFFYTQELQYRKRMHYPPYARFIKLVWRHSDEQHCAQIARSEALQLQNALQHFDAETRIIGPAPCFFRRVRSQYRWQAIIATQHLRGVLGIIHGQTRATIDVEPNSLL